VQSDEQVAIIRAGIAELPDAQREAMALYAFGEMHYREIADVLDAPINTVKTLIHRARASLARSLESLNEE
jgi:RNA polymerase sigma-70 factor (ECF subfamily)